MTDKPDWNIGDRLVSLKEFPPYIKKGDIVTVKSCGFLYTLEEFQGAWGLWDFELEESKEPKFITDKKYEGLFE